MKRVLIIILTGCYCLSCVQAIAQVSFVKAPAAVEEAQRVRIEFSVSKFTDVAVKVISDKGKVIRHLIAGMLGKNAPAPLQKGTTKQVLYWDLKDDQGKKVEPGDYSVHVGLGLQARPDSYLGCAGGGVQDVHGMGVGPDGTLYILVRHAPGESGHVTLPQLYAFSQKGEYLRTVVPFSGSAKTSDLGGVVQFIQLSSGERVPYPAERHKSYPDIGEGSNAQNLLITRDGRIGVLSDVGWGPPIIRSLRVFRTDGTLSSEDYYGPQISLKDAGCSFAYMALSPDDKYIYISGMRKAVKEKGRWTTALRHVVYRTTWESRGEPELFYMESGKLGKLTSSEKGAVAPEVFIGELDNAGRDNQHLSDPRGIATDKDGNIYVADHGNNRIVVFKPDGSPLASHPVERPDGLAVHPESGQIYVLQSGGKDRLLGDLLKMGKNGEVLSRLTLPAIPPLGKARYHTYAIPHPILAMDAIGDRTVLWVSIPSDHSMQKSIKWASAGTIGRVWRIVDAGTRFEKPVDIGAPNRMRTIPGGARYFDISHKEHLLYFCLSGRCAICGRMDLKTETIDPDFAIPGAHEPAISSEGDIYIRAGWRPKLMRFDHQGRQVPFSKDVKEIQLPGTASHGSGVTVAPNGDIYILQWVSRGKSISHLSVQIYSPDGRKKKTVVRELTRGAGGVGVDRQGNVYVVDNIKRIKHYVPDIFVGKVGWLPPRDARFSDRCEAVEVGCAHAKNPFVLDYGSLFKFGPEGGTIHIFAGLPKERRVGGLAGITDEPPPGPSTHYNTAYAYKPVWVEGLLWDYFGVAPSPAAIGGGHYHCTCITPRFDIDGFDRIFVPDGYRHAVQVLDSKGNQLVRFGSYGNIDEARQKITLNYPRVVLVDGDTVYVKDHERYVLKRARLYYQAEKVCLVNIRR